MGGSASNNNCMDFSGKEVDMVYSQTSGGGFKFSFNFEFEWELLPGIPGVVQDGYSDNTSYGGDNKKPYKPVYTTKKPSYTTKKPVYTTKKPVYTTKKPTYTT